MSEEKKTQEETKAEETKAEETKAEETKAEETKAEETKTEDKAKEEPKAEAAKDSKPAASKEKKEGNTTKKIIIGAVIAVVAIFVLLILLVAGILLFMNRKRTVKINDYVQVEFEGYNEIGNAGLKFDSAQFRKDVDGVKIRKSKFIDYLMTEQGYSKEAAEAYLKMIKASGEEEKLLLDYCDNGTLSQYSNLSNGDEIVFESNIDKELVEKIFKVKIKENEKKNKFTAGGFEVVPTFDPFEGINVTFTGFAPDGRINIDNNNNSNEMSYLYFRADKTDGLSNGDVVTIECSTQISAESYVDKFGKLPGVTTKEFTVSGLLAYIGSSTQIPEETMNLMKGQAESALATRFANWYNYGSNTSRSSLRTVGGFEYVGNYYLTLKDGYSSWSGNNICYLVYKVTTNEDMVAYKAAEVVEQATSYIAIGFYDLRIDDVGNASVDIASYDIKYTNWNDEKPYPYDRWGDHFKPTIYGYQSIDLLYNEVVTKNVERYNYENNVTAQ